MKALHLPHKACDLTCMINPLEDMYEWKTGVHLPGRMLFFLSGMAGFTTIKQKHAPVPRMVITGARTKEQYTFLQDIVGFQWAMREGRSFDYTFKQAKTVIDDGNPVVLGALDMYHLPYYEKFYHRFHIPIHYILMVGYDDTAETILVHDCGCPEPQIIPYRDLALAWDVRTPGYSDRHTMFTFTFDEQIANVETIARTALARRADAMLNPPVSLFGIKAMRKLAREITAWPDELSPDQLDTCLRWFAEYTGFPPMLPWRLMGVTGQPPQDHSGARNGLADMLRDLAADYQEPLWAEAATLFDESGQCMEALTAALVDHILGERDALAEVATLLKQIAATEESAYHLLARVGQNTPLAIAVQP
ncbi:BtrH N-terminal domain-containing protein [Chloroflexota bacterium]